MTDKTQAKKKIVYVDIYPLGTGDFWKPFFKVMGVIALLILGAVLLSKIFLI